MNKNQVLFVTNSMNVGGTEKHLSMLLPELKAKGWEVSLLLIYDTGDWGLLQPLLDAGVKIYRPCVNIKAELNVLHKIFGIAANFIKSSYILFKHRRSIIHFFLLRPYLLGGFVSWLFGNSKMIMSRRCITFLRNYHPLVCSIERTLHKVTKYITGNCSEIIDELNHIDKVPMKKLYLIYNCIAKKNFEDKFANIARINNKLILVVVANLYYYKGHQYLLAALAKIDKKLPPWELLCIGKDQGEKAKLVAQAEKLRIANKISWLENITEVDYYLYMADIGISASLNEGMSNAVLEYMRAGLPVVATDAAGNGEMVLHNKTGFLVAGKDSNRLADGILQLALDAELRQRFGLAGKQRVAEAFTVEKCVNRYEELYTAVYD